MAKESKKKKNSATSLGMEENVEALLAYVLIWITGIVFLIIEKKSNFVKFHAMQSLVTFLGLTIIAGILTVIPFIGVVLAYLIGLLAFILWIVLMIKAYQHEMYKLPVVGDLAENLLKKK